MPGKSKKSKKPSKQGTASPSASVNVKQAEILNIKAIIAEAYEFYLQADLAAAQAKYQEALDKLFVKNQLQWFTPQEQADYDMCGKRIAECKQLLLAQRADVQLTASLRAAYRAPSAAVVFMPAPKQDDDKELRVKAELKIKEADNAFKINNDYKSAFELYIAAYAILNKIEMRSSADEGRLCRCSVQRKDCERLMRLAEQNRIAEEKRLVKKPQFALSNGYRLEADTQLRIDRLVAKELDAYVLSITNQLR